jgi:hypothetical protein
MEHLASAPVWSTHTFLEIVDQAGRAFFRVKRSSLFGLSINKEESFEQ